MATLESELASAREEMGKQLELSETLLEKEKQKLLQVSPPFLDPSFIYSSLVLFKDPLYIKRGVQVLLATEFAFTKSTLNVSNYLNEQEHFCSFDFRSWLTRFFFSGVYRRNCRAARLRRSSLWKKTWNVAWNRRVRNRTPAGRPTSNKSIRTTECISVSLRYLLSLFN